MAANSKIEWTDATWNPVTGCSVLSPGCTNCYAMTLAGTRMKNHPSRAGLTVDTKAGPVWNGVVRFNEQWLDQPLRWRRPRRIFVCAHGDLFHENVPDEWIDKVFAVMALAPHHTFQVLTKRPDRMREYVSSPATVERVYDIVMDMAVFDEAPGILLIAPGIDPSAAPAGTRVFLGAWPLPNVMKGTSAEDQARADLRIPDLLATPAAVRFVSVEPLLGPVDLTAIERRGGAAAAGYMRPLDGRFRTLDWIIVGGESGPNARPMRPDWARSLRNQCAAAGVPFFFKQWGEFAPAVAHHQEQMYRIGKKAAGRLLDGVRHDGFPAVDSLPVPSAG